MGMRKTLKTIGTLGLAAVIGMSAYMVSAETTVTEETESADVRVTYELLKESTYTISIPSSVTLGAEGASMKITATEMDLATGDYVEVTLDSEDPDYLWLRSAEENEIISAISINGMAYSDNGNQIGTFRRPGTISVDLGEPESINEEDIVPGTYYGTLTFLFTCISD